jgi:hypothetical protein
MLSPNLNQRNFHIRYGYTQTLDASKRRCLLSPESLDAIAEEKMSGGYSNKRNPICSVCYIRKSNTGVCSC